MSSWKIVVVANCRNSFDKSCFDKSSFSKAIIFAKFSHDEMTHDKKSIDRNVGDKMWQKVGDPTFQPPLILALGESRVESWVIIRNDYFWIKRCNHKHKLTRFVLTRQHHSSTLSNIIQYHHWFNLPESRWRVNLLDVWEVTMQPGFVDVVLTQQLWWYGRCVAINHQEKWLRLQQNMPVKGVKGFLITYN